jgi:glycosyltransferase involved in cell wall biosynthesis
MKICLIGKSSPRIPPKSGIPVTIYIHTLAEELSRKGHQVDVICAPSSSKKAQIYNIIEVGKPRIFSKNFYIQNFYELWFSFSLGLSLRTLQRQNKWDVIHFLENPATAFSALIFAKNDRNMPPFLFSTGIPVSGTELTWGVQSKRSLIWRTSIALHTYVFRHIDNITTSSHRLKEVMVARTQIDGDKVIVTPLVAAEPEMFHPEISSSALRQKHGLTPDDRVLLCLGELAPYKNQITLLKAMPEIVRKLPVVRLLLVGGINKLYQKELDKSIKAHKLERLVIFTGFVKDYADLPKYYNLAEIYVLLSKAEGNLPKTTLEAMSCGKAIIASDIPQNREGAIRGDEMILVNPYDVEAISSAINRLFDDSDLRLQLGANARRTIIEYYTPEVVAKRMVEVYGKIVNGKIMEQRHEFVK